MNTNSPAPANEKQAKLPPPEYKDYVQKELDNIQSIISRMAGNSFQCKGWAIGIVTITLAINKDSTMLIGWQGLLLLLPVFVFWYLDGFFLYTEQCYRKMYNEVVDKRLHVTSTRSEIDLTNFFDYNYTRFEDAVVRHKGFWTAHFPAFLKNWITRLFNGKVKPVTTIASVMFSKTLVSFYVLPAMFVIFAALKGMGYIELKEKKVEKEPVKIELDSATIKLLTK